MKNGESFPVGGMILSAVPSMVFHLILALLDGFLESVNGRDRHFRLPSAEMKEISVSPEVEEFGGTPGQLLSLQLQRIFQVSSQERVIASKIHTEMDSGKIL